MDKETYILVVGSRGITDYTYIKAYLSNLIRSNYPGRHITIVSGGARGVDTLAERFADENCYKKIIVPADWNKYGKSAGYKRNIQMHAFIAEKPDRMVVAFWDGKSKGTAHNFKLAEEYNNKINVVMMD